MTTEHTAAQTAAASPVEAYLRDLHRELSACRDGAVADYIPELAKANPEAFGIALASVDGATYAAGDTAAPFTIQSVSKPFMFGYALQAHGLEKVLTRVGVEPTGDPFNSIVLDDINNRPFNPMVNAGAIAMSELLVGGSVEAKAAELLDFFSRFAGRQLEVDAAVYRSESETGHRNRAIAYMMLNAGMIDGPVEEVLDLYFRQCAILVTTRDLAVMAATLAAHGRNPVTGEQVIAPGNVRDVLSVMATCGMYDYAGQWMFDVGLPAKSGVSGAVIAVLPGQIGLAVHSPRIDAVGNSVRGVAAFERFAQDFRLHAYVDRSDTRNVVRRQFRASEVPSNRVRSRREIDILKEDGSGVCVVEAQGPLFFATAERLIRQASAFARGGTALILDLGHLVYADKAARLLLRQFARTRAAAGERLIVTGLDRMPELRRLKSELEAECAAGHCAIASDIDHALEAEEDRLLLARSPAPRRDKLSLADMDLFQGLARDDIAALESAVVTLEFAAGEMILHSGETGRLFFIVARGSASIYIGDPLAGARRVASVGPGQSFGEMALLDGGRRSANVRADVPVLLYGIAVEEVRRLSETRPKIIEAILANLIRSLSNRLRAANDEIAALD